MSAAIASPPAEPLPENELSLTGVEVSFSAERPQSKMRLVIKMDGKDRKVVINKGDPVQWTGTLRFRGEAKVNIHIHRRNRAHMWTKFASASVTLSSKPPPITDDRNQISVTLTVRKPENHEPQISTAVTGVAAAKETVEQKIPIVEKLKPILRVLEVLAKIGEPLKDIHPAIGIAVGSINALIEVCKMQGTCREEALTLVDELASFLSIEPHIEVLKKRVETRRAVNVMLDLISESSDFIREKTAVGLVGLVADLVGSKYREKIDKVKKEFVRAKEAFDRSVALTTFAAVDGIALTTQLMFLHDKLSECDNAHFASDGGCLEDTRVDLRQSVERWLDSADEASSNIFWLYGKAGSGKTTIANTVAKIVQDERKYTLTCFFCKRDDPGLSSPRRLLPTLAYSFAHQYESYRAAITKLLQGPDGIGIATTADVKTQFEKLFQGLLVLTVDPLQSHVVLVEALDESGTQDDQKKLAAHILALSRAAPWIKVFVTSRDEPEIRNVFAQASDCISRNINDETDTDSDIQLYIKSQATELRISMSDENIQRLVDQAAGLFIWCRTLFEHLRDDFDPNKLLHDVLYGERQDESPEPWMKLYGLYDRVLLSAAGSSEANMAFTRTVLLIIDVTARNTPLSVTAIISFLNRRHPHKRFSEEAAERLIKKLHAVLYVAASGAVRAHHTSFYDFLRWKASTAATLGWQSIDAGHLLMADSCLKTLHDELQFNICAIEIPVLNKDIPDLTERISTRMSEMLQYSSRYWFTHLHSSTASTAAEVAAMVAELFCSKKLLFWFECLSLLGVLSQIEVACLTGIKSFFQDYPEIVSAAQDAHRFVAAFAAAMDSIPHIYLSALLWLPEESLMYRNLELSKRTEWHLISNKKKQWDAHVWRSDQINASSVVFSPDGRFVAYGTTGGMIYIRDSQTGALEGESLRGHQEAVSSLAYSPDGRFLAAGSDDCTVRICDVKTGQEIFAPLEGYCVAFSPDGLFVASADDAVRIWNAQTGKSEGEPMLHSDRVGAVAYSPDGRFIASACHDRRVHVWDISSHQEAFEPLRGYQNWARSVAYSPDGHTIVSSSFDNMIRVWNAHTGQEIGEPIPAHTDWVTSVAYSPDGRSILSGSHDGTVRLWDAASRAAIGEPLRTSAVVSVSYSPNSSLIACASVDGVRVWDSLTCCAPGSQSQDLATKADTGSVSAVAYSPNGRFIASGSGDNQIRIWDAHTGALVDQPVLRHPEMRQGGSLLSIAYSRDGHFIVSGSADKDNSTVCVLDVQTGATVTGPLQGHSGSIWSVAYSPDGRVVASASWDETVRLWDLQTGAVIGEPLQVGSYALSVAFSPDGYLLACGTQKGSIYIWDTHTRTPLRDPIQAHSDWVCSVGFSPDGRHIASGSDDRSMRIWDAQTGEASRSPLQGHQRSVSCVAYSPDGHFIASSSYGEVIIWDTQSGAAHKTLRGPSTDIRSVSYSPDGHILASGARNGKIYVHAVSDEHDDTEARWISGCSQMDQQDGWVKDGDSLLLWTPVPYREDVRFCARFQIPRPVPDIVSAYSIDYRTLIDKYSGSNWTAIFSGFDD